MMSLTDQEEGFALDEAVSPRTTAAIDVAVHDVLERIVPATGLMMDLCLFVEYWRGLQRRLCPPAMHNDEVLSDTLREVGVPTPLAAAVGQQLPVGRFVAITTAIALSWGRLQGQHLLHVPDAIRDAADDWVRGRTVAAAAAAARVGVAKHETRRVTATPRSLLEDVEVLTKNADALARRFVAQTVDSAKEDVSTAILECHAEVQRHPRRDASVLVCDPLIALDRCAVQRPATREIAVFGGGSEPLATQLEAAQHEAACSFASAVEGALAQCDEAGHRHVAATRYGALSRGLGAGRTLRGALAAAGASQVARLRHAARLSRRLKDVAEEIVSQQQHDSQRWVRELDVPRDVRAEERARLLVAREMHERRQNASSRQRVLRKEMRMLVRPARVSIEKPSLDPLSLPRKEPQLCTVAASVSPLRCRTAQSKIHVEPVQSRRARAERLEREVGNRIRSATASHYPDRNGNAALADYVVARRRRLAQRVVAVSCEEERLRQLKVLRPHGHETVGGTITPLPCSDAATPRMRSPSPRHPLVDTSIGLIGAEGIATSDDRFAAYTWYIKKSI